MMPEHIGIEDCRTMIDSEVVAGLFPCSLENGPYITVIGNVPVGAIGINMTDDSCSKPSETK
jgi:hypothetical protein